MVPPVLSSLVIAGDSAFVETFLACWQDWSPLTSIEMRLDAQHMTLAATESLSDRISNIFAHEDCVSRPPLLGCLSLGLGGIQDHTPSLAPILAALGSLTHLSLDLSKISPGGGVHLCLGFLPKSLAQIDV